MAKYDITFTLDPITVTIDTDEFEDDFAKTKDELVDKLDGTEPDVVHDWAVDTWEDHELIDFRDITVDRVIVKAAK